MNPVDGDLAKMLLPVMALQRCASGDEVAAKVAYLAGLESGYVTGASLTIDGGFTA
jgi:3-oxoacyl-[acyl-carrier protein] reductase